MQLLFDWMRLDFKCKEGPVDKYNTVALASFPNKTRRMKEWQEERKGEETCEKKRLEGDGCVLRRRLRRWNGSWFSSTDSLAQLFIRGVFQWGKVLHLKGVSFFRKGDESAQFRFQFTASISERKGERNESKVCFGPYQPLFCHVCRKVMTTLIATRITCEQNLSLFCDINCVLSY